jgi:transposase
MERKRPRLHLAVDAAGLPLAVILTPGQAGDNPQLLLLDDIRDRSRVDWLCAMHVGVGP